MNKVLLIAPLLLLSGSAFAEKSGSIRAHYSLEKETTEVAAEVKITPTSKVAISGVSDSSVDMKYAHLFAIKPNFFITGELGVFTTSPNAPTGNLVYGRLGAAYIPHEKFILFADFLDSVKLGHEDLLEQQLTRTGITFKPTSKIDLTYRYSYFNFKNIPADTNRHEAYASYTFENGVQPFVIVKKLDDVDTDVNLGIQYNF